MASIIRLPDGRKMSYDISGAPRNPIVLLSNSLCAPFGSWDRVVPTLTSQGYRVLRYDQPGHGASSTPSDLSSTTFDSLAADVKYLIDGLQIAKLFAWIGVSMGAATGIVFASNYPSIVQNLIPCDTISCSPVNAGTQDVFAPRVEAARSAGNMDAITKQTLERWFVQSWRDANPAEVQRMQDLMRTTTIEGFTTCVNALTSSSFDLRPLAPKLGDAVERVLVVVGENDANLPQTMAELKEQIEKGAGRSGIVSMIVIPNAGHVCYVDGFEVFCEKITHFLQQSRARL